MSHISVRDKIMSMHGTGEDAYSLRIYDTELITFRLYYDGLSGLQAEILSVNHNLTHLFPLDMEVSGEGVVKWLGNRVIPKNRAFVDEILKSLGLNHSDTKGIIDVCKGLSLNDSYWVVPVGSTAKFRDYNLYENEFSDILALVAYTGIGSKDKAFTTSPELTTNGALPKAWRTIKGDGIYLYKGGSFGAANTGKEPYSEYYAYQIAERMGLDAVPYDLENWKGILASKCKLFTDINTSFVPAGRVVKSGGLKGCLEYYESINTDAAEAFKSMLVFDAVIYNEDRHYSNFGILRDNRTGKVIGAAPIFDNGISLFSNAMPQDFKDLSEIAKTKGNPYDIPYENICSEVMGTKQKQQLRRLIGFEFNRHPSLNLPEDRLKAIEKQIQVRVRELLAIRTRTKERSNYELNR